MKLRITAVSDVGCLRSNNEDMVLIDKQIFRDDRFQSAVEITGHQPFLLAVADGMGGANAGEVASQMVLEGIREHLHKIPQGWELGTLKTALRSICQNIHQTILKAGNQDPAKSGMGTTLTALLWYESRFYSIHAGDSRIYRYRNGKLTQLTEDHTLQKLQNDKSIPSNIIYNAFGAGGKFFTAVDFAGENLLDEDMFLLCSDGVSDMLSDEEIETILSEAGYEETLLDRCKKKGGRDNISYVLAEISDVEQS